MNTALRALRICLTVLFALAGILCLFLPAPKPVRAPRETYLCVWEDGTVTREDYLSAFSYLESSASLLPVLVRNGITGSIVSSDKYLTLVNTLQTGELAELLSASTFGISRLERASLYLNMKERVYYGGGCFVWGEHGLETAKFAAGNYFVLMTGTVTPSVLAASGARTLELRAEAELSGKMLVGTEIQTVIAEHPYTAEEGAICLDTASGKRLVAALPGVTSLAVTDVAYADAGALCACADLRELTLPFAGLSPYGAGEANRLAELFKNGSDYCVPACLTRLKVTEGRVSAHAFYRMEGLEYIDLCGLSSEEIDTDAFADCTNLRYLHTPCASVNLSGNYVSYVAPCGCTIYERTGVSSGI